METAFLHRNEKSQEPKRNLHLGSAVQDANIARQLVTPEGSVDEKKAVLLLRNGDARTRVAVARFLRSALGLEKAIELLRVAGQPETLIEGEDSTARLSEKQGEDEKKERKEEKKEGKGEKGEGKEGKKEAKGERVKSPAVRYESASDSFIADLWKAAHGKTP